MKKVNKRLIRRIWRRRSRWIFISWLLSECLTCSPTMINLLSISLRPSVLSTSQVWSRTSISYVCPSNMQPLLQTPKEANVKKLPSKNSLRDLSPTMSWDDPVVRLVRENLMSWKRVLIPLRVKSNQQSIGTRLIPSIHDALRLMLPITNYTGLRNHRTKLLILRKEGLIRTRATKKSKWRWLQTSSPLT